MGGLREFNNIMSWNRTLGDLKAAGAEVRAVCDRDHLSLKADLDKMIAAKGPGYTLWNRTAPCRKPGCSGRVFFSASHGNGWPANMRNAMPHEVAEIEAKAMVQTCERAAHPGG